MEDFYKTLLFNFINQTREICWKDFIGGKYYMCSFSNGDYENIGVKEIEPIIFKIDGKIGIVIDGGYSKEVEEKIRELKILISSKRA